ncbi:hypothetical protein CDAR_460291 [Caerostris darwini]|uniref:Uncharacterized protein n=1 Tax=Caerostris darwini TaxID=1538125 RepID=A0AAV4R825_9ARAC|nr:hypothetical protein CDAR_460291 [Caerostris darwini]
MEVDQSPLFRRERDEERFKGCSGSRTGAARSVLSSDDTICRRQSATDWTARNDRSFLLPGLALVAGDSLLMAELSVLFSLKDALQINKYFI